MSASRDTADITVPPTHSRGAGQPYRYARRMHIRIRWGALAAGSMVGIAAWATLYVWGAGLMYATASADAAASSPAHLFWSVYGGLAAGVALWLGSAAASLSAGASCKTAGVLHGLVMWGMANITLVGAVGLLGAGAGAHLRGPLAYVVHIGAQAVSAGADVMGQDASQWPVGGALGGMGLVMATSLGLSVWGGIWGVWRANPT